LAYLPAIKGDVGCADLLSLGVLSSWERGCSMKLSLIVLTPGKSEGQAIPVTLAQFLIGRDPQCNLRPASALISKRHCAVIVRGEKVFLRDFGSTNGTFVNDQPAKDEVELRNEDVLKVGPLSFKVRMESSPAIDRPTPPPPTRKPAKGVADDESAADMLMSMLDDGPAGTISRNSGEVPEGSTVMDIIAMPDQEGQKTATDKAKEEDKKKANTGNTSVAAKAILDKYMRRPRG
jgi:pSer/pThr/pTyr-binding forkhead associated (FHA) protein